ncbi:MAG: nucleotidyltransferase family protein [Acidobacteria bacterium]|nr:nucleotidyltransferase family protein [Acidobacteriota bacterium]
MAVKFQVDVPTDRIAAFCRKWQITELALFGSVLREDFRPDSDLDVLAAFGPGARHGLFDLIQMEKELEGLFGRKVDLVDKRNVEQSDNYIRRKHILESAEIVYGP